MSEAARAFAGAAFGAVLGLAIAGPIGLLCGLVLGAAFAIGEEPAAPEDGSGR